MIKTRLLACGPLILSACITFSSFAPGVAKAVDLPDVVVSVDSINIPDLAFVGTPWEWTITVSNPGGGTSNIPTASSARWPSTSLVFQLDVPAPGLTFTGFSSRGSRETNGSLDCTSSGSTISCISIDNFELINNTSNWRFAIEMTPELAGEYLIPAAGGICAVDPDDIIAETDETNNDCTGHLETIVVRDAPEFTSDLMQVTMWDNVVSLFDYSEDSISNAVVVNMADGTDIHALDDIVRHPISGDIYVFQRYYQSNQHSLGVFDGVGKVDDIGPTGVSFHDAAFDNDGLLYAVGRDSILYTINLDDASVTALCDTGHGSDVSEHSALAYDPGNQELIQLVKQTRITIDTENLPVGPTEACITTEIATADFIDSAIFAAEFISGELVALDAHSELQIIAADGAIASFGILPRDAHGMIADPGTLPVPVPNVNCKAAFYTTMSNASRDSLLFAVDQTDATLSFIAGLPYSNVRSLDLNLQEDTLVGTARSFSPVRDYLFEIDPCSGIVQSETMITTNNLNGFDNTQNGLSYAMEFSGDLHQVDLDTGNLTPQGGASRDSNALAIVNDDVILDLGGNQSTELMFYSLSQYSTNILNKTLPLSFGPGLEEGTYRRIRSIDANLSTTDLYAVLERTDINGKANSTSSLPNAFVKIDESGNVTKIGHFPASVRNITGTPFDTFTVTSSVGTASGSIDPLGGQTVVYDKAIDFILTPASNYHIDSVGGTCDGTLVGNTFTTVTITADCTVVANFAETLNLIFTNGFE